MSAFILGIFMFLGFIGLGYFLADAAITFKQFDRGAMVKGLSEREYNTDIVIWPIQFTTASSDLESLYNPIDDSTAKIKTFLNELGIDPAEINVNPPAIDAKHDLLAAIVPWVEEGIAVAPRKDRSVATSVIFLSSVLR
ncbi:hypothetical protein [Aurantivibrio infirmus]